MNNISPIQNCILCCIPSKMILVVFVCRAVEAVRKFVVAAIMKVWNRKSVEAYVQPAGICPVNDTSEKR